MRKYQLSVVDMDGEAQEYRFFAMDMFRAVMAAKDVMLRYGHTNEDPKRPVNVQLEELIPEADMSDAMQFE